LGWMAIKCPDLNMNCNHYNSNKIRSN